MSKKLCTINPDGSVTVVNRYGEHVVEEMKVHFRSES